jgi:hypothetical protein
MATALELEQCDAEQARRETRNVLIGHRVIQALGEPGDLLRVQVRQLWDGRYRVNVFVGADAGSARVANSFFLEADGDGNIITSTPAIRRQYDRAAEGPGPLPPMGSAARG